MSLNNQSELNISNERQGFGRTLEVPQFVTIFDCKRNALSEPSVIDIWIRHIYETSLMSKERFEKTRAIRVFGEHFFPFCDKMEKYEQVFKMMLQFFVIDDHSETEALKDRVSDPGSGGESMWVQMERALDKLISNEFISMSGWKPYTLFTYAIQESICNEYNDYQKKRFVDTFRQYYNSNVVENALCKTGSIATEAPEYLIELRKVVSGSYTTFVMTEYSEGITVTEEEWEDPLMISFLDLAAKSITYWNDIYSFEKELIANNNQIEKVLNVVAITSLSQKLSVEDSMIKLTDQLRQIESKCQEVSIQLVSDPNCSEMKKIFIDRIKYMIGANYLGVNSDRYDKPYIID